MNAQIKLTNWHLDITADMVLRGQGADPAVIRRRSPRLGKIAEQGLDEGLRLIQPAVVYRILSVELLRHESLLFVGGAKWTSALLSQHLAQAEQVVAIVCTLGEAIERQISVSMPEDPSLALALDGFGSAALDVLGAEICSKLEAEARASGLHTSIPISPGMIGWPVDVGQRQIFTALDAEQIGVTLNDSFLMIPRKSISMVLGIGSIPFTAGRPCDFCGLRETCRYQNREAHFGGQ
jgi:hypothetical protein